MFNTILLADLGGCGSHDDSTETAFQKPTTFDLSNYLNAKCLRVFSRGKYPEAFVRLSYISWITKFCFPTSRIMMATGIFMFGRFSEVHALKKTNA